MSWDRTRRVPWARLGKMYVIYAVVANAVLYLIDRAHYGWKTTYGTVIGGLFYLALIAILVKFGFDPFRAFRRPTPEEAVARREAAAKRRGRSTRGKGEEIAPAPRPKPPPTRRTSAGPNRPRQKKRS